MYQKYAHSHATKPCVNMLLKHGTKPIHGKKYEVKLMLLIISNGQ